MMKNTEWGAVAYLSHSRYGIDKEVNINNNSEYKTGYSAYPSTDQSDCPGVFGDGGEYNAPYNTSVGYLASTTGNITGVYDMSGGAYEYVASYLNGEVGKSNFTNESLSNYDSKYFDVYNTNTEGIKLYKYRILGDATGEMSPIASKSFADGQNRHFNAWYNDVSGFVTMENSWFHRGGYYGYGILAGQFDFSVYAGNSTQNIGSRLVLAG
ncbi:MAG: hypothetical protein K2I70_01165, partial [Bacilli bacterium]|nr:hypothetical protein [Bacilli bacterium]